MASSQPVFSLADADECVPSLNICHGKPSPSNPALDPPTVPRAFVKVTYAPAGPGQEGVMSVPSTVERRGQTIVTFGKYKDVKHTQSCLTPMTYPWPPIGTTWNYCVSHYKSGSPAMKDLVNYFKARRMDEGSQAIIPGSHASRTFREN